MCPNKVKTKGWGYTHPSLCALSCIGIRSAFSMPFPMVSRLCEKRTKETQIMGHIMYSDSLMETIYTFSDKNLLGFSFPFPIIDFESSFKEISPQVMFDTLSTAVLHMPDKKWTL